MSKLYIRMLNHFILKWKLLDISNRVLKISIWIIILMHTNLLIFSFQRFYNSIKLQQLHSILIITFLLNN